MAGALAVFGIALAPSAGAVDDVSGDRIAGINRYGTAAAVAGQDDFDGATTAILATGETFPDALAASGLAGSNAPAPIILTESNTYSNEAAEALTNLTSITDVIIVGGTAAISQGVEDAVEADGFTVSRVAGTDRYATAAAIAGELATIGEVDGLATALIATGTGFADALAGGPLAYAGNHPILLVTPDSIPAATSDAIADLGIEQAIILGGTAAVSDEVAAELDDLTGNPSVRVADVNRFGTAAAVGEFAVDNFGWAPTEVFLAFGLNFPDALAGGPIGGARSAPILLTASLPAETEAFLDDHSDTITSITALGGTGVIDEETLVAAETAAETVDNDEGTTPTNATATTRPELVSASIVETRTIANPTTSRPTGTYVLYCFDEAVTGADAAEANFHLYNAAGARYIGSATGSATTAGGTSPGAVVSGTDNKCIETHFGTPGELDTAALASTLTLATVNNGAVFGQAGAADPNIEGDAPLTPSGSTSSTAGVTSNPDLVSVGNFRGGSTADLTAVDFTFDAPAFNQNTNGYHLVTSGGGEVLCIGPASGSVIPSGGTVPGGEGTAVHTVQCEEATGGATFSETSIVRGFVDANTVDSTDVGAAPMNPLQAADVGTGASDGPDLTTAIFSPDAITGVDVVAYLFDENVSPTVLTAGYAVYSSAGTETVAVAGLGGCSRSSENNAVVTCVFADGTLSGSTVGANVKSGSATDLQAIPNRGDEVGVAPVASASSGAGFTDGPDLTGVTINSVTSPFGTPGYTVTYTFDEDTADGFLDTATGAASDNAAAGNSSTGENVLDSLFHLYTADGIDLVCTGFSSISSATALANRTEDQDHTVTCTSYTVAGGATATTAQIGNGVVGTVDYGAADDEATGGDANPEGGALTTGGTGTPAS